MDYLLRTEDIQITINNTLKVGPLNIEIKANQIWGILGPNGSGKTTLLRNLSNLHPGTSGKVMLNHRLLSNYPSKQIAQHIGILFQEFKPFPGMRVYEYCLASRYPYLNLFQKMSKRDHVVTQAALMTMGLWNDRDRYIQALSGGEKRRVQIAALIAQQPQLYLLDEPLNHLDLYWQHEVLQFFLKLTQQNACAVVMVLHDATLAEKYCDQIIFMHSDGKIAHGPAATMLQPDQLSELYQVPFQLVVHEQRKLWISYL